MPQQQSQFHEDGPPVGQYEPHYAQPSLQREVNSDPREQPDYNQGYYPDPHMQGEKLRPTTRPRRRSRRGLWLAIVLGLVLLMGAMSYAGSPSHSRFAPHPEVPSSLAEYKGSTLNLHAMSADIHVHFGTSNVVRVASTGSGVLKGDSNGSTITLNEVDQPGGLFGQQNETIDITAPADEHLILQTTNGNVEIDNIAAQVNVSTENGDITVDQARFENGSSLQTKSGDIHFTGNLAEKGTYAFTTENGNVEVGIPASEPAKVSAHTVNGQVQQAEGAATTASSPDLIISTNTGDIKFDYTD